MPRFGAERFSRAWRPLSVVLALTAGTMVLVGLVHLVTPS
jgi:hypothetical protein